MAATGDDFEDLYDEPTLVRLARPETRAPRPVPAEVQRGWRGGLGAGAIAVAVLAGVETAVEPERRDPVIEEIDLADLTDERAPVVYHHVPGAPKASRAVVRPWLL